MAGRYNKKKKDQKLEQGTRQLSVGRLLTGSLHNLGI